MRGIYLFKIKYDEAGNPSVYKTRLVIDGSQQIAGLEYGDTYAPSGKQKISANIHVLSSTL